MSALPSRYMKSAEPDWLIRKGMMKDGVVAVRKSFISGLIWEFERLENAVILESATSLPLFTRGLVTPQSRQTRITGKCRPKAYQRFAQASAANTSLDEVKDQISRSQLFHRCCM